VEKAADPTAANLNRAEGSERAHSEEVAKLRAELEEAHRLLHAKVEDYHSLSR
jgi:hypothetical protein